MASLKNYYYSGCALNWWASIPDSRSNAETVAEAHGCLKLSVKETMDCLRKVDAQDLFNTNLVKANYIMYLGYNGSTNGCNCAFSYSSLGSPRSRAASP